MLSVVLPQTILREAIELAPDTVTVYANLTGGHFAGLEDNDSGIFAAIRDQQVLRYYEELDQHDPYLLEERPEPGDLPFEKADLLLAYPVELTPAELVILRRRYPDFKHLWGETGTVPKGHTNKYAIPAYARLILEAADSTGWFRHVWVRSDTARDNWFAMAETTDGSTVIGLCQWGKTPESLNDIFAPHEDSKISAGTIALSLLLHGLIFLVGYILTRYAWAVLDFPHQTGVVPQITGDLGGIAAIYLVYRLKARFF